MKRLTEDEKLLLEIKKVIKQIVKYKYTPAEFGVSYLYEYAKKNPKIHSKLPSGYEFGKFIKKKFLNGTLKGIIPNVGVDTLKPDDFRWYFHKEDKFEINNPVGMAEMVTCDCNFMEEGKTVQTIDGNWVRTGQEKLIWEKLISKHKVLKPQYEKIVRRNGEVKLCDFYIKNIETGKTFYWEHFGMTNDIQYLENMQKKRYWYKENGFSQVEEGGELIYTYYTDDKELIRDIDNYIELILEKADN